MDRFFGFDLGDAESCVARLNKKDQTTPEVLKVAGEKSFITAYARTQSGELIIGEKACYAADVTTRRLRFKSHFLSDPAVEDDVTRFASGVLGDLYSTGSLIQHEDACVYIGCPAGWDAQSRERYRSIFQRAGYPPVRVVSESRAAMVSACQSKHLQIGYDILSKPVLVIDIGSSTTDFAYICGGREVEIETAGEVSLGGGLMDEKLLQIAVENSRRAGDLQQAFSESEPWKNYCEFRARRLKEKYFSDEAFFENNECVDPLIVRYKRPVRLTLKMDKETAGRLLEEKLAPLSGRSFHEIFTESLRSVKSKITADQPQFLFLTGGVSRLKRVREWCHEVFPDAVIITSAEPEYSVAKGLAWCGRIDDQMREFKADLQELKDSSVVEDIVTRHIVELYHSVVDALVDPILEQVVMPVFDRWRSGEIQRLCDTDAILQQEMTAYLHSDEAARILTGPITSWLKPVAAELERHTIPICVKHNVPYAALSLNSYFSASDLSVKVDTKDIFAVDDITLMIDSIISILVGLLCGGSGVALVSSGPTGILAGVIASFLVLALGKDKMEEGLMKVNLPRPIRKMVSRSAFETRLQKQSGQIKGKIFDSLINEKNEEITTRLVNDISVQIESCLTKMAEVVEIPLGS